MKSRLTALEDGYAARHTEAMITELYDSIRRLASGLAEPAELARVTAACETFEKADAALFVTLKEILITGVRAFEQSGADVRALGRATLV